MKKIMIAAIRLYQKYLSPLKGTKCPYFPSCSGYGLEAIETHGAFRGGLLALWRILRCNPFSKGGYDPVPEEFLRKKKYVKIQFHSKNQTDENENDEGNV